MNSFRAKCYLLFENLLNAKFLIILTSLVYLIIHVVFYNQTEWLNTDYERQIFSIANTKNWFFIEGGFSSRVPPIIPIVWGLTLKLSRAVGLDIYLFGKLLNLSLIFSNAYFLYKISNLLISNKFRLFAPFFYLLNPIILYYSFKPLSEHLFMFFFLLFIYYFIQYLINFKDKKLVLAIFTFSISLLVKPTYLYFTSFLLLFLIYHNRKKLSTLLIPLLIGVITILPWSSYCYIKADKVVISSTGNIQSLKDGIAIDNKGYRNELTNDPGIRRVMDEFWKDYGSFTSTGEVLDFYIDQTHHNLWGLIKFQVLKIFRVFFGTDTINKKFEIAIFSINFPIILMFLFWLYKILLKPVRSRLDFFFLGLVFYTIFIGSIVVPLFRYLLPIFYIIPIFALLESKNILSNEK